MTVPSVAGVFNASGIDINVSCVFNIPLVYCNKGLIMAGVYEINEREGFFFVSLELINGQHSCGRRAESVTPFWDVLLSWYRKKKANSNWEPPPFKSVKKRKKTFFLLTKNTQTQQFFYSYKQIKHKRTTKDTCRYILNYYLHTILCKKKWNGHWRTIRLKR